MTSDKEKEEEEEEGDMADGGRTFPPPLQCVREGVGHQPKHGRAGALCMEAFVLSRIVV